MVGDETEHKGYSLTKPVRDGGVVSLGGQEAADFYVTYLLTIRTRGLMIGAYSDYQTDLSDLIIELRDVRNWTFKQIADHLITEGYRSPRGFDLGPESVFSIYKKRKIRNERLNAPPELVISQIEVIRPRGGADSLWLESAQVMGYS